MKNPAGVKAFGVHLRQLREAQGLSQQQLADLADIAKKTVTRIENGNASVTNDVIFSIARALQQSPEKLFDFVIPKEK